MDVGTTGRMLIAAGATALGTIALDQATKAVARDEIEVGDSRSVGLGGGIGLRHVRNHGVAYGAFSGIPPWVPIGVTAVLGAGLLAGGMGSRHTALAGVGAGLVIGGGVGNAIDRVRDGYVTDFLRAGPLFGVFNIADVAVSVGVVAAGAALLMRAR